MTTQISPIGAEGTTGRTPGSPQWRDKKRHLWLMGLIPPTALFVMLPRNCVRVPLNCLPNRRCKNSSNQPPNSGFSYRRMRNDA
jgi:hypothetical protein